MAEANLTGPFSASDEQYERQGYVAIPVAPRQKKPAVKDWAQTGSLSAEERARRRSRFQSHNIGLLAGTALSTGRTFGFIDIDHEGFVPFVTAVMAPISSDAKA